MSTSLEIKIDDLSGPEIRELLTEHLRRLAAVSPPESRHALDLDGLRKSDITFWSVWQDRKLVGCGALKELEAEPGEVKSMRTAGNHRRKGVGSFEFHIGRIDMVANTGTYRDVRSIVLPMARIRIPRESVSTGLFLFPTISKLIFMKPAFLPRLAQPANLFLTLFMVISPMYAATSFPEPANLPVKSNLPDPLMMMNGTKISNSEEWFQKRRPELRELFEHYMYGTMPKAPKLEVSRGHTDKAFFGGKATKKQITLSFGSTGAPKINVLLIIPNARRGPAPAFVGLNFCGNHALVTDTNVPLAEKWMYGNYPGVVNNKATEAARGSQIDVWAAEQTIDRGYALAAFYNGDVEPDHPDAPDGLRAWLRQSGSKGEIIPDESSQTGTIAAWAWGISRVVDYLVTDPDIDSKRIAAVGHSRNGKAAAVAAAFDDRIALSIPHQAGCGGTAPSRGKVGESVKAINDHFPHWFDGNFKKFNDQPERLPFDQNCLIALIAPRPVLLSNAVEDSWANPAGQFEVLRAAEPVYKLLKVDGLGAGSMPEPNKLLSSRLGFYIRPGKHSMTKDDWKVFLDFADANLGSVKK